MSGTIAASAIVNVVPSVLSAGGNGLVMNGLMLSNSTRAPIGSVLVFSAPSSVSAYFGPTSPEFAWATIYFNGFTTADTLPGQVLFAQYPTAPVSAFLRGGVVSTLTLTQLQAITGTLTVPINGTPVTAASLNLSSATSFSSAASLIQAGLGISGPTAAVVTGSITTTTLTVTAVTSGTLVVGQILSGTGITAGTTITALGTGTGGVGTYTVSVSQTAASTTVTATTPAVSYDSLSGVFVILSNTTGAGSTIGFATGTAAAALALTSATGAVTSQGAVAATPSTFMNALVASTQDWGTFGTVFNPDVSGNANKLLFAQWTNSQNNRYAYVCWDTDITPTQTVPATSSLGYIIDVLDNLSGTILVYDPNNEGLAPFVMGWAASLDFSEANGAATLAFKQQTGLSATVTTATAATNLLLNSYNFYGAYATANQNFIWFYNGQITGGYNWADAYIYQIWLNNAFQLALMELLQAVKSIPYNATGYAMIENSLYSGAGANSSQLAGANSTPVGPIAQAVTFGIITPGTTLSATQIVAVNTSAGKNIATTLQNRGWYLQVVDPGAQSRAARTTPACKFFYCQGGSVQQITLASIELQ